MKDIANTAIPVVVLIGVLAAGIGIQAWLAPVPAVELTPAQANLVEGGDTMMKGALGAIFGYATARLTIRNGRRD